MAGDGVMLCLGIFDFLVDFFRFLVVPLPFSLVFILR